MPAEPLLAVESLTVSFRTAKGWTPVVRDLSFQVSAGETLCLVGESGCGKSVTALSILRLLPRGAARIDSGRIRFAGRDLATLDEDEIRAIRGNEIAMIFQEPMTSLNPVLTIGEQISEALIRHERLGRGAASRRTLELLERVRIPDAPRRLDAYPHQLSGGMRQRVMIAMALACRPKLLVADEPTTALDVTIQAQILTLLGELRAELGTAVILITHDLGVVAEVADRVVVLYTGSAVEEAEVCSLFDRPRHPYTIGLMRSVPRLALRGGRDAVTRLVEIPGTVPAPTELPDGCTFAPRCPAASDLCRAERPAARRAAADHHVACWHAQS